MAYRWAAALCLAMLLSGLWPTTAWAQPPRAEPEETGTAKQSPTLRFAAAADETHFKLGKKPPPKRRSVLQPSTAQWLQPARPSPADDDAVDGSPSIDLTPPELLAPETAPPAEMMEDVPGAPGPSAMTLPQSLGPTPLEQGLGPAPLDMLRPRDVRKQPMLRESWQFHPFNISIFEGGLFAAPPILQQTDTAVSFFTGFRIGWDYDKHFGGETRFGFSKVFMLDATHPETVVGYEKIFYVDSNLLIYPWGDTKIRPFLSIGGGLADILIVNNSNGLQLHPGAFNMPLGGGIKYRYGPRVAFRADIRDNLTFSGAGGASTLNNIEVVGGIEFHFGSGTRRTYWPWNPTRNWW